MCIDSYFWPILDGKTQSATLDFSPSVFRYLCEGEQMYEYVSCGADAPLRVLVM